MATTPVFKMTPPWTPELLPEVQTWIETKIKLIRASAREPRILELGSGWSTVWFASMMDSHHTLYSLEHNREWHEQVRRILKNDLNVQCEIPWHVEERYFPSTIVSLSFDFDITLVDCVDEARLPSLFASLAKVPDGGWIVVDDSHWSMFAGLTGIMNEMGYGHRVFKGDHVRKTGEKCYHQTTIFSKEFL